MKGARKMKIPAHVANLKHTLSPGSNRDGINGSSYFKLATTETGTQMEMIIRNPLYMSRVKRSVMIYVFAIMSRELRRMNKYWILKPKEGTKRSSSNKLITNSDTEKQPHLGTGEALKQLTSLNCIQL